jgi:hypothetical protein
MSNVVQRTIATSITAIVLGGALAGCSGSTADTEVKGSTAPSVVASSSAPSASPSAEPSTTAPSAPAAAGPVRVKVTYAKGKVTGGVVQAKVPFRSKVELTVTSDVADEVHVHGYNRSADVAAGKSVTLKWTAKVRGTFEVELEGKGTKLAEIAVR